MGKRGACPPEPAAQEAGRRAFSKGLVDSFLLQQQPKHILSGSISHLKALSANMPCCLYAFFPQFKILNLSKGEARVSTISSGE